MWDLGARGPVSDPAERSGATNGNKAIWGTVDTKGHFPGSETTPHPTGSSQHLHSLPRASHPPLPPHLHPRSPSQSGLPRSAGPPVRRRPQLAVTYSPGNPGAFHALLPSRGTRHIPARRPLSGARVGWGGAEQGGACGLARFAPYARLHRAPCGRGADQAAESKGEVVVTPARTRRVGRGERQGSCQEVSREVEGIARDVAPPCGQRAGVLGRWARGQASALCPPL